MEKLKGKVINYIERSDCEELLKFGTVVPLGGSLNDGYEIIDMYYKTTGDCCNIVTFYHINGVELLPALITDVKVTDWAVIEEDEHFSDVLENAFIDLMTVKGVITIEVRNSHNGYYGGSVDYVEDPDKLLKLSHFKDTKFIRLRESV